MAKQAQRAVRLSENLGVSLRLGIGRTVRASLSGAGLQIKAQPHMLRHACGYALANKGHGTRAHRRLHSIGAEPVQGLLAVGEKGDHVDVR
jgi:site-specific recombinase XerD